MPIYKLTAEVPSEWVDVIHYVNAESTEDAIRIVEAMGDDPNLFHRREDYQNSDNIIHTWWCEGMSDVEMQGEFKEMDDEETEFKVKIDLNYYHR
jgi:hypothetical protein